MIRVSLLKGGELVQGDAGLIDSWDASAGDRLWVDIEGPTHEEMESLLERRFGFHELAAEDSLSESTLPKYDPFGDYDFFIFRAININVIEHGVETTKMATFLSEGYLFTIHLDAMASVEAVYHRLPQDGRILTRGTDFLLYSILDVLVDLHFPLLEEIEEMVDEIQTLIFKTPNQSLLDELLRLKRDLNILRRYSLPQRDLFNQISRGDAKFVERDHLIYFRDLFDHMFRISESIDVERDLLGGTMDAYLSVIGNRTNEIMKVLTLFSVIMLPLNVVVGFYGMNFQYLPFLHAANGWQVAIGLMLLFSLLVYGYFIYRGWIWSRKDLRKMRRTGYKRISWPVRYARVVAKKVGNALP